MRYLPNCSCKKRRGAVAAWVALCLSLLLGATALAVDGGLLMVARRKAQGAADAAALAAAIEKVIGSDPATAATGAASANGFNNDGKTNTVTVKLPGQAPLYSTSAVVDGSGNLKTSYYEVTVQWNQTRTFSAIFGSGAIPVKAHAVARAVTTAPSNWGASILTLNSNTGTSDVADSGNGVLNVPGPIISNANITTSGKNAKITSGGTITYSGTESGNITPSPTKASSTTSDPLASLAAPTPSAAGSVRSTSMLNITSSQTLQPGVYQGGISVTGGTVTLSPGIYYLEGGGLSLNGQASVMDNGQGVLIYNGETNGASNNPSSVGSVNIQGQASLNITPMSSGTWQGISIFQDRSATAAVNLAGGGAITVNGMIYAPNAAATIAGNGKIGVGGGTSFITSTLSVTGNGNFTPPTIKVPIPGSGTSTVNLVE
jgi:hypothetical protein